ncbi:MAG: aspartate aminotransferase, partial [Gammaproteobacteria bacterium]|nr:aspartate aminotransferase [Gammaproteobacteria bacterium]
DYLVSEINQIRGLKLDPIEATYLAWIDVSTLELDNPQQFFIDAGLGFSPGQEFGDNRFMRLNFGCNRATLQEAVARIKTAVNNHWSN